MKRISLSRNQIKYIAIITMLIDHLRLLVSGPAKIICSDIIGRISFPIFMFIFIDGFYKTKHPYKHIRDLLIFGLISEVIYDLYFFDSIFYIKNQNVLLSWTFCWIFLILLNKLQQSKIKDKAIKLSSYFILTIVFAILSEVLYLDYSIFIIVCASIIYLVERQFNNIILILIIAIIETIFYFTPGCLLVIPVMLLYDENKECKYNKWIKYSFYIFYPVHLMMLLLLKRCLF